jgi:hypothetical protein
MAVDKYALTLGINQYIDPSANLSGCVNDANDWAALLRWKGYQVTTLLDSDVTRENVLEALRENVSRLGYRDRFIFQYSGHGSWVPDRNGDEIDGRDEVLVMQDFDFVHDDDLYPIFAGRSFGSRVVTLSDSCHSGSVTRFSMESTNTSDTRFLNPAYLDVPGNDVITGADRPRASVLGSNGGLLISGCKDDEYSYDAWFGNHNRPNGAFTRAAIDSHQDGISYKDWHSRIHLPTEDYPQSPQLSGTWYQKSRWQALD